MARFVEVIREDFIRNIARVVNQALHDDDPLPEDKKKLGDETTVRGSLPHFVTFVEKKKEEHGIYRALNEYLLPGLIKPYSIYANRQVNALRDAGADWEDVYAAWKIAYEQGCLLGREEPL